MSFRRYPSYKPSGVDWLGDVPSHWDVAPLKRNFLVVGGSTPRSDVADYWDGDIPWATPVDLSASEIPTLSDTVRNITSAGLASCGTTVVPAGSLLLSTRAPIGSRAIAGVPMCTNQGCRALVARPGIAVPFFAYALAASVPALNTFGRGSTFLELSGEALGAFKVPTPPESEQRAVATFLDRETAKIDALVAEQERLIELLKEKRQAVISHAVTKGLNPDAPMKPSGIDWLGGVPAHWRVARLAHYATVENGSTPDRERLDFWEGGAIPWVASGEVNQDRITEASALITTLALASCSVRLLPIGTIVVGLVGQGKTRGMAARLEIDATINQNLGAIVPGPELQSDYVLFMFQAMYEYLREFGRGGNQAALNCEILSALRVPIPPHPEQHSIATHVSKQLASFDALTADAERAVELLMARRAVLVSAAVTGQIDVRGLLPVAS